MFRLLLLLGFLGLIAFNARIAVADDANPRDFFKRGLSSRAQFPAIQEDAIVELHYMEYVLTAWLLEGQRWNAYHSGMGFVVNPGPEEKRYHVEFVPRITTQIRQVLVPRIEAGKFVTSFLPSGSPNTLVEIAAWIFSDYHLEWENEGGVFFTDHWPKKYTNFTKVGDMDGKVFNQMRDWFFRYQENHKTFEPVEIIDAKGTVLQQSELCHDLFYRAIDKLYSLGFRPRPVAPIFRDHVLLFTASSKTVTYESQPRAISRFYRLYDSFMDVINKEFSNIRSLFLSTYMLSVQPFIYKGSKYQEVVMTSPYINYCYMEVTMPPGPKAHFYKNEKLCGLGSHITKEVSSNFMSHLGAFHILFLFELVIFNWKTWPTLLSLFLVMQYLRKRRNSKLPLVKAVSEPTKAAKLSKKKI